LERKLKTAMSVKIRRLIGTLAIITLVVVYAFAAMMVALIVLPGSGTLAQFSFYAVAGVLWAAPAAWIISWMYRK
jgi:hypothetical protein